MKTDHTPTLEEELQQWANELPPLAKVKKGKGEKQIITCAKEIANLFRSKINQMGEEMTQYEEKDSHGYGIVYANKVRSVISKYGGGGE